ncbi:uncharacterized protein [Clytia hemisphaerica]|uniref:uncharacterized protein isoform X2 n=1 Tax=Clytia hemisphaerica TaxID=252671 RepID=UPI0034D6E437
MNSVRLLSLLSLLAQSLCSVCILQSYPLWIYSRPTICLVRGGHIAPSQSDFELTKGEDVIIKVNLYPYIDEHSDWVSVYYADHENSSIDAIWNDDTGVTEHGISKFGLRFMVTYTKDKSVEVEIKEISRSMVIYVSTVFLNAKGQIKNGPLYSTFRITLRKAGYKQVTTSPVCYKGKDSSPGFFTIKDAGSIAFVKLQHVSGYIACGERLVSRWACGCCYKENTVLTLITDSQDRPLFPDNVFETRVNHKEILLVDFDHMSNELVLPTSQGVQKVNGGDVWKIWFGEDYVDWAEFNNSGEHCVHVSLFYA